MCCVCPGPILNKTSWLVCCNSCTCHAVAVEEPLVTCTTICNTNSQQAREGLPAYGPDCSCSKLNRTSLGAAYAVSKGGAAAGNSSSSSTCSGMSWSSSSRSSRCCCPRAGRAGNKCTWPCKRGCLQPSAAQLLLVAVSIAVLLAGAAEAKLAAATKPQRTGCIVDTYNQLLSKTLDYSDCGGGGDDAHIFLGCSTRLLTRGRRAALQIEHDALETSKHEPSVHIRPESDCGVITLEVDLDQNPELPVLTVHGDLGIHKFVMENVRIIIKGANASAAMPLCTAQPCQATPIIDIHDVEHVDLVNVTVTSERPSDLTGTWPQLPNSGISIKTLAGGVPVINLDGVTATKMVDGVRVIGGGNLTVKSLRSSHNHNMGLYYMCSMVQASQLTVTGKTTIFGNGGLRLPVQEGEEQRGVGIHIDCDGDFITLGVNISGDVVLASNSRHGILVDGHVHASIGPGVRLQDNGHVNITQCGGGVHAHFMYGSPAVRLQGVQIVNNTAAYGAGACIEVPENAKPLVGKVSGEFHLLSNVSFQHNRATKCGGAFATAVSPSKSRVEVLMPDGMRRTFNKNRAPRAPVWCAMPTFGDDYMAINM